MNQPLFTDEEMQSILSDKKKKNIPGKVRFKPYDTGENYIFPQTTDEYIPQTHIARFLNTVINRMDIIFILETYKGGGTSSYNPRMMLKVWLLGFIYKRYTSRSLEQALKENLAFIWISGGQTPDFRTLNNFRLRLNGEIKKIFKQVVQLGLEVGIVEGKDIFVDHTKIEANANKHKIVWRKQVERQLDKIETELEALFKFVDELNIAEDKKYRNIGIKDTDAKQIDETKINEMIDEINKQLKDKKIERPEATEVKKKLRRTRDLVNKQTEYENKKSILDDRNSYSKTDTDATAMMQKDKLNIKPGYNEGIAVENGFVFNYVISQKSSDNNSFIELMNGVYENIEKKAENVHADGAYGSEENGQFLKEDGVNNYLKFSTFRNEKNRKWRRTKVRKEDFKYLPEYDCFICVNGGYLHFEREKVSTTATGYKVTLRIYVAQPDKCSNCPYKKDCTTGKARSIQVSVNYEELKETMRSNLNSKKGKELQSRRSFEVEGIFGDRKYNNKSFRYVLRGLSKVTLEAGFYYTTHNLKKIYNYILKNWYSMSQKLKSIKLVANG